MRKFTIVIGVFMVISMISGCVDDISPTAVPEPAEKATLLFLIDEGLGKTGVTSVFGDDFEMLRGSLENIYEAISPLKEKFQISVLIYPMHHYLAEGYKGNGVNDPMDRISPNLHEVFRFFGEKDVGIYLEMHSSGIRTNQNGELASLPLVELNYSKGDYVKSLPMDIDTMIALKEKYTDVFKGIRFHELIGSNDIGVKDKLEGNEEKSHAWVVQEHVVKAIIDGAAESGLELFWSDHSWHNLINDEGRRPTKYRFWFDWVDYAAEKLDRDHLTLSWANNGWPVHQYIAEDFRLAVQWDAGYGESIQSWFWYEMCAEEFKGYNYAEMDMPAELMAAFTMRALDRGARIVQYEPSYYFFNSRLRNSTSDDNTLFFEEIADMSARSSLKRFIGFMLDPHANEYISADMTEHFDTDRTKFYTNQEYSPAKRYYQITLGVVGKDVDNKRTVRYFDRYGTDLTRWTESSMNRLPVKIFNDDLAMISRANMSFNFNDEIMAIQRTGDKVTGYFYTNYNGLMTEDKTTFSDNDDGKVIAAVPLNIFSEYVTSLDGTGDDMIIIRGKDGEQEVKVSFYKCTSYGGKTHQGFRFSEVSADEAIGSVSSLRNIGLFSEGLVNVLPFRNRGVIMHDSTRPSDPGVIVINYIDGKVVLNALIGATDDSGLPPSPSVQLFSENVRYLASCTADIDGDRVDEICIAAEFGEEVKIVFLKLDGNTFTLLDEVIDLGKMNVEIIFSMRNGSYTR